VPFATPELTLSASAPSLPLKNLPPLPRTGVGGSDLSPLQRRAMVGGILGLHVMGLWGLLQVNAVRQAVMQAAPMFVDVLSAPRPPAPEPPPVPQPPMRQPLPAAPPPVIAAPASPEPAAFSMPAPPPEPPAPAPVPAPSVAAPAPPVVQAPPSSPKLIPASAVQYLEPLVVDYPRQSKRNGEVGLVVVRAYVDSQGGASRSVAVEKSSGFVRLDQAAIAAVQRARFKPYTENGQPVEGWALIPIHFELEK